MNNDLDLLKHPKEIGRIAKKGQRIYDGIKKKYEPKHRGKYMAIDVCSGEVFLGKSGSEAMIRAKKKYPDSALYVERVGHDAAYTILHYLR